MFVPTEAEALTLFQRGVEALQAVVATDRGEWAVELQRCVAQVDAVATRAARDFDANGDLEGAHGSVAWLAHRCRMPRSKAKRIVANGRALERMAEADAAFGRGDITSEHVAVLASACELNAEAFAKAEEELVHDASTLRYDTFGRRVAYWRQVAEPDLVEDEAEAQFSARSLHASKTFENSVVLDGTLDAVGGAVFLNELRRLEQQLFEQDWADAKQRLGRDPHLHELRRTPAQRRADAIVLMAERSAAKPPGAVEPRVLLQVLVGYETFAGRVCELADGTVLTPGQVVSLLDHADVQRVVYSSPSRVIDVGAKQRLFRGATRTAIELRDLECQAHGSCEVRFPDCEADHVQPFAWGGPTIQDNGKLKCRWHHRQRQRSP